MAKQILVSATDFCAIVGIQSRRFEMQRQRERARIDAKEPAAHRLPIAPLQSGQHSRFGFFDALAMRAVMILEAGGLDFEQACDFVRTAGLAGFMRHDAQEGDYFITRWLAPDGTSHRSYGTAADLARATPAAPVLALSLNITAAAVDVEKRAAERDLGVRGGHFFRGDAK